MKQKYTIFMDNNAGMLLIKEFSELDKGIYSLIFEEKYKKEPIETAIKNGKEALIAAIRKPDFYPIAEYAEKIADSIIEQFNATTPAEEPVELVFSDIKLMQKEKKEIEDAESKDAASEDAEDADNEDASVEIDDLLEDESAEE